MTNKDKRIAVQKILGVSPDGVFGPKTHAALDAIAVDEVQAPAPVDSKLDGATPVDSRSEENIATLHPTVKPFARRLVRLAAQNGLTIKVISGSRTYAEQDALYAQGNVTEARGGYSNHNFGLAFDIGVFQNGKYLEDGPEYAAVGKLGKALGLSWGGDWHSFVDEPHFELHPNWADGLSESDMLVNLRARHAAGKDAFA